MAHHWIVEGTPFHVRSRSRTFRDIILLLFRRSVDGIIAISIGLHLSLPLVYPYFGVKVPLVQFKNRHVVPCNVSTSISILLQNINGCSPHHTLRIVRYPKEALSSPPKARDMCIGPLLNPPNVNSILVPPPLMPQLVLLLLLLLVPLLVPLLKPPPPLVPLLVSPLMSRLLTPLVPLPMPGHDMLALPRQIPARNHLAQVAQWRNIRLSANDASGLSVS
ncbi:hypothetical protein BU15DRAFT_71067 [Melanogaster broomeanus]|nr:hypothetical protein BU15DRAFT_71067 [Melanogaster broomeanus]